MKPAVINETEYGLYTSGAERAPAAILGGHLAAGYWCAIRHFGMDVSVSSFQPRTIDRVYMYVFISLATSYSLGRRRLDT